MRALGPPLRLAFGPLESLLALNVDKEARKDAIAIQYAGQCRSAAGLPLILQKAQEIDREFLARLPLRLEIRYQDIEPIRRRRMERLLDAAARLAVVPWPGIRRAVRASYAAAEFNGTLREHLQLYGAEVHALSRSVRVPALIAPARRIVAERLRTAMEHESKALARDVTHLIYDRPMR